MTDIPTLISNAIGLHSSGRLDEAEALYNRALALEPGIPDAIHLLGVIALERGEPAKAAKTIRRAIRLQPDFPAYHGNLALAWLAQGKFKEAENAARAALKLDTADSGFLESLGSALGGLGKLDEAGDAFRRALEIDPANQAALNNLGVIYLRNGEYGQAAELFSRLLALTPSDAAVLCQRAGALIKLGRLDEAERDIHAAMAGASGAALALKTRAHLHMERGAWAAAAIDLEAALAAAPGDAHALADLGMVQARAGDHESAVAHYRRAAQLAPSSSLVHQQMGLVFSRLGMLDEAEAALITSLEIEPSNVEAFYTLATGRADIGDSLLASWTQRAGAGNLTLDQRTKANFALARQYQNRRDTARAFGFVAEGNRLRKIQAEEAGEGFSPQDHIQLLERIARVFSAQFFAAGPAKGDPQIGDPGAAPIFVVGMPRSGTTLVEQIIGAHDGIESAGELIAIEKLCRSVAGFPETVPALDAARIGELGVAYMEETKPRFPDAGAIIDKMPFNFVFLGFIHLLFPGARIIHCLRDKRDVGLSCFFQYFDNFYPWSSDLGHLGLYLRSYERLMDHWRSVLPGAMLEVHYEELATNPDGAGHRIMDYVGRTWDADALFFHERRTYVATASKWQVREPINSRAIGRWRDYQSQLKPMIDAMQSSGRRHGTD